jgi:uncharacterized protein DUF4199
MIFYNTNEVAQTFPEQYLAHMREQWASAGMSADEINTKIAGYEKNMEMYSNNYLVFAGMTMMEILPLGIVITLLSALILKRK